MAPNLQAGAVISFGFLFPDAYAQPAYWRSPSPALCSTRRRRGVGSGPPLVPTQSAQHRRERGQRRAGCQLRPWASCSKRMKRTAN